MNSFGYDRRHIVAGRANNRVRHIVPHVKDVPLPFSEGSPISEKVKDFLGTKYRMPRYRRRRTRRRRKIYRKRFPRPVQPYSIVRKLKTSLTFGLDAGAGTISTQLLKLNSASNPISGSGGQPLGFDQYTALYNRYCVIGWKVHVRAVSTDNTNALAIGFCPKIDSTTLTTYLHYLESPQCVMRHMTPDIDKVEFVAKGGVKRWLCPKGEKLLNNEFATALFNADPTKVLYGHIFVEDLMATANPTSVNICLVVEQLVCFFEPIVPSRS